MTDTATCADCSWAARGPRSAALGASHERLLQHVVWYDVDPGVTETETWEGVQDNYAE